MTATYQLRAFLRSGHVSQLILSPPFHPFQLELQLSMASATQYHLKKITVFHLTLQITLKSDDPYFVLPVYKIHKRNVRTDLDYFYIYLTFINSQSPMSIVTTLLNYSVSQQPPSCKLLLVPHLTHIYSDHIHEEFSMFFPTWFHFPKWI